MALDGLAYLNEFFVKSIPSEKLLRYNGGIGNYIVHFRKVDRKGEKTEAAIFWPGAGTRN